MADDKRQPWKAPRRTGFERWLAVQARKAHEADAQWRALAPGKATPRLRPSPDKRRRT